MSTGHYTGKQRGQLIDLLRSKHLVRITDIQLQLLLLRRAEGYIRFKHAVMKEFNLPDNGAANVIATINEWEKQQNKVPA